MYMNVKKYPIHTHTHTHTHAGDKYAPPFSLSLSLSLPLSLSLSLSVSHIQATHKHTRTTYKHLLWCHGLHVIDKSELVGFLKKSSHSVGINLKSFAAISGNHSIKKERTSP